MPSYFWLTFVDRSKPFRGVCIVAAPTFERAVKAAHRFGCHPGGPVAGRRFVAVAPMPPGLLNRLYSDDGTELNVALDAWLVDVKRFMAERAEESLPQAPLPRAVVVSRRR